MFGGLSSFAFKQEAAKANMEIIQAKLQECVNSGQLNSFDRLSNLFAGKSDTQQAATEDSEDVEMRGTNEAGKDASKIAKKSSSHKHAMEGQYGNKTARKLSEKRQKNRGRGRSAGVKLEGRKLRSSSKKRSGKKLAMIS